MRKLNSLLYIPLIFAITLALISCGIKGDPKPPDRSLIPRVDNLDGKFSDGYAVLSWAPTLRYSDGHEIRIRRVEIYKLVEELDNRLKEYQDREERQMAALNKSGAPPVQNNTEAVGPLNSRIMDLSKLPVERFMSKSRLAASIPVEQLLDIAAAGKLHWKEPTALTIEKLPTKRYVYAIREVDDRGRKSPYSNLISLYPIRLPQGPEGIETSLTQEKLTLFWQYPSRSDEPSREMALIGFNVYRASGQDSMPPAPINPEPLPTGAPMNWSAKNIISHQRIDGNLSRYAYLFTTSNAQEAAGISQTIFPPEEIASKVGITVNVEAVIYSIAEGSNGRLILDASVVPGSDALPYGSDIFREDENPLIHIENIRITKEPQRFSFSAKVPVGALAYVLRIEPRSKTSVSASFVVESVTVLEEGGDENLITNGDFDGFAPVNYSETISQFGQDLSFKVGAVYSVSDMIVEVCSEEEKSIEIIDTFPPDAPRGIRAQATFDSITLTWSAARATDLRGYIVFRRTKGQARWRRLNSEPVRQVIYRDQDVEAGVSYEYKVEAQDTAGNLSENPSLASAQVLESERRNRN